MMISELLKLGRGSIVELTKLAGNPLMSLSITA
jgi:flagellar motor switch/type III secretory pathway protein FliN